MLVVDTGEGLFGMEPNTLSPISISRGCLSQSRLRIISHLYAFVNIPLGITYEVFF